MLGRAVAVLAAANVLNNRIAPRWAPLTSTLATGALLVMARRSGLTARELGFADAGRGARLGGLLAATVAVGYGAGVAWARTRPLFRDERALRLSRARLLEEALLQVPVGTVLLEEVGFRGVLYGLLDRDHGPRTATAASSLLFGLWHILPALDMAAANPALGGLVSGTPDDAPAVRADAAGAPSGKPDGDTGEGAGAVTSAGRTSGGTTGDGDERTGEAASSGGTDRDTTSDTDEGAGAAASAGKTGGGTIGDGARGAGAAGMTATVRTVVGTVLATTLAGAFFCALRRRGGLLAPALLHTATNSLGYAAAVTARALDARRTPAPPARS